LARAPPSNTSSPRATPNGTSASDRSAASIACTDRSEHGHEAVPGSSQQHRRPGARRCVRDHHGEQLVGLLHHHVRHSPDGFSWGYTGSGPADLARCLLIDALGDEARCVECAGTGRLADDAGAHRCHHCDGDGYHVDGYQQFKTDVVARFPPRFTITDTELIDWWQRHRR
jgi:Family of unknown function (DUF6166)